MNFSQSILKCRGKTNCFRAILRCKSTLSDNARFTARACGRSSITGRVRFDSHQATNTATEYPKLVNVPSYPFVGSIIPQLSGTPKNIKQAYEYWSGMRQKFGDFYTMGMPFASRKDSHGTIYIFTDPREMVNIIRKGGLHPSGLLETLWVIKKWLTLRNMHSTPLFGQGKEWKRMRTFMQKDLLSPESARGYVPSMIQAAKIASQVAPGYKDDLNKYLSLCALDLFSAVAFGEMIKSVDPAKDISDNDSNDFALSAYRGLGLGVEILFDPLETILSKMGITSKKQLECFGNLDKAWDIGRKKIDNFIERKELGTLTENEMNSYLSRAIDRQNEKGSMVSLREAQELVFTGLFAAVDTTSSYIGWVLFHMARTPRVQEKLYEELTLSIETVGDGALTDEVLDKRNVPYLHAVIRESHRLSPVRVLATLKSIDTDMKVNGVQLEPGDVVGLEGYTTGMNPDLVDEPELFVPERWLPDAVESRKGTPKEIIDHQFFQAPFSLGARRCPGSRVAANETQVMIAQLVLDWKMTSSISSMNDIEYYQKTVIELKIPSIGFESRRRKTA